MIRAAFVGIDRYRDPLVGDLTGAARDARALWAVLSDSMPGLAADLITDDEATLTNVVAALDATLSAAEPDDVVLLGFAGHGTPDHRLVLADSRADDLPGSTISMASIADQFRRTRARVVVLFLDCCFSGGAPARVLDLGLTPRAVRMPLVEVAGQGRVLFAASAPDQPALEDPRTRHGLFTKAVLDKLLEGGPVSVMGMVDDVVRAVRSNAGRMGYEQTPVMFGFIEGELSLPACIRGPQYLRAFPEFAPIRTTGDFRELAGYGIADDVLEAWRERYPTGLNALQIASINDRNVLGGNSLLTVAPTSAGKTFVGEIAAIKAITEGRKAVFLLPYKALVNEKYEDFSAIYGKRLQLRVARCSGDWQDQVGEVLRGKYDLAFFTYEKFLGLLLSSPHILAQIGLVVIDEAQFITDPGRGMVVELLLTYILSARARDIEPQVIALSAVIGDVNGFERWLDCHLLVTTLRPVPLIEGVIDRTGAWTFVRTGEQPQSAQMIDCRTIRQRHPTKQSDQDLIVPLLKHLVGLGEKIIVFRNQRGSAAGCAKYLAAELGLPPAAEVLASLPDGDPSVMSGSLRQALEGGVAFHHGDLNREERIAVEHGFRKVDGGIQVLVATSTVAAGVNTPASTVVVVETTFRNDEGVVPYTVAQYKNMAGRAGRLGYEDEGKAILIADNATERSQLLRTYVQGNPEPLRSSFDERDPGTWLVRLMAQVRGVLRTHVVDLVLNTYGGFLANLRDPRFRNRMTAALHGLLERIIADGLIDQEGEVLHLTMLGRACGESPLGLESAMLLVEILRNVQPREATPQTLVLLLQALPERDEDYTPQMRQSEPRWQQIAAQRFGLGVANLLRRRARTDRIYYARCKRALIVSDWIDGVPTSEIERRYTLNPFAAVGHGDIRGFADGSRFLLEAAMRIASIVLSMGADETANAAFFKRLDIGVPADALPLTELGVNLTRGEILRLWNAGIRTADDAVRLGGNGLEKFIGVSGRRLFAVITPAAAEANA